MVDTNSARDSLLSNSLAMARWRSKSRSSDRVAARASPSIALSTLASSALVKPLIAETTMTGRKSIADLTIAATFRKELASSTDVPPNFMMVGFVDIPISLRASGYGTLVNHRGHRGSSRRLIGNSALSYNLNSHLERIKQRQIN